jgi:hypothetical protein
MKPIIIYGFLFIISSALFIACSDMNELHQKYIDQGEKIYAAKVDSVNVRPGDGRIQLDLFYSSMRITKSIIYWNNRNDSLEAGLPASGKEGVPVLLEDMEEDSYSFEIVTLDKDNNRSLIVEALGEVYGENYKTSLFNVSVINAEMVGSDAQITWGTVSSESGIFGIELKYTDMLNEEHDVKIDVATGEEQPITILQNYLKGTKFKYRTLVKPETMAIDTFYAGFQQESVKYDVTSEYLKNYTYPFEYDLWDGSRWGTLKNWLTNSALLNKGDGLYGGFDGGYNGVLSAPSFGIERWGEEEKEILNGKIYQTFTIPAGKYQYIFSFGGGNPEAGNSGDDPRYIIVAKGEGLPDISNLSTALASASLAGVSSSEEKSVEFTIDEPTKISLGVVVNWTNTSQNIRAHHIQLFRVE